MHFTGRLWFFIQKLRKEKKTLTVLLFYIFEYFNFLCHDELFSLLVCNLPFDAPTVYCFSNVSSIYTSICDISHNAHAHF